MPLALLALFLGGCVWETVVVPEVGLFVSPQTGQAPLVVEVRVEANFAPRRVVLDLGDGTVVEGTYARHVYREPGTFTVRASLEDAKGRVHVREATVEVWERPRVELFEVSVEGLTVSCAFVARGPHVPLVEAVLLFGDGYARIWEGNYAVLSEWVTHTYAQSGSYTLTLRVVNAQGLREEATRTISVIPEEEGEEAPPRG